MLGSEGDPGNGGGEGVGKRREEGGDLPRLSGVAGRHTPWLRCHLPSRETLSPELYLEGHPPLALHHFLCPTLGS